MRDELNGFPIIGSMDVAPGLRVILVDRGARSSGRYVTARHAAGEAEWHLGHYFNDVAAARASLHARVTSYGRFVEGWPF